MKQLLVKLSGGNPGAINCLVGMLSPSILIPAKATEILHYLNEYNIKGTDVYVLFSDICERNYDLMHYLCTQVPQKLLVDACSRQDYSGKGLVAGYVLKFEPQI